MRAPYQSEIYGRSANARDAIAFQKEVEGISSAVIPSGQPPSRVSRKYRFTQAARGGIPARE